MTIVKDYSDHDMRYAIDTSKIQKELVLTPQKTFKSGVEKQCNCI